MKDLSHFERKPEDIAYKSPEQLQGVLGGQGNSAKDVTRSAAITAACLIASIVTIVAVFIWHMVTK